MARSRRVYVALAFLFVAALACAQGQISRVAGAPFVAFRTITITANGQTRAEAGTVARRSDGSTYFQSGNDRNTLVLISDMRLHRLISFNSRTHIYSINLDPEMKGDNSAGRLSAACPGESSRGRDEAADPEWLDPDDARQTRAGRGYDSRDDDD